jgi:hypothetical protein
MRPGKLSVAGTRGTSVAASPRRFPMEISNPQAAKLHGMVAKREGGGGLFTG